jgi:hypothetical protein
VSSTLPVVDSLDALDPNRSRQKNRIECHAKNGLAADRKCPLVLSERRARGHHE